MRTCRVALGMTGVLVAALACCRGARSPSGRFASADSVTLTYRPPQPGEAWTLVTTTRGETRLRADDVTPTSRIDKTARIRLEVLAASAREVTRARLTWLEAIDQFQPVSLAGKSYLFERRAGVLSVTTADGRPVPDAEARVKSVDSIGDPPSFLRAVSGRTFVRDQKVTLSADELRRHAPAGGMQLASMTLTFIGMRGPLALFSSEWESSVSELGGASKARVDLAVDPRSSQLHHMKTTAVTRLGAGTGTLEVTVQRLD